MLFAVLCTLAAAEFHGFEAPAAGPRECSACNQLTGQGLQQLVNAVLQVGVGGTCGKICTHLPKKAEQAACEMACMYVGVNAFSRALEKADLDPIYFCELVHACAAGPDDAAVSVVRAHASPASIAKGADVELGVDVNVTKASGVGEYSVTIDGPVTEPQGQAFLLPGGLPEGPTTLAVKLSVKDQTDGDFPVVWQPGTYTYELAVCQGECGSKHPHSKVFGTVRGTFELTATQTLVV
jgi:hypothetical protein